MGIKQLFDNNKKLIKRYGKEADKVIARDAEMQALSDKEIQSGAERLRERYNAGETLDDLLVDAFALMREGARRVLGLHPYRVQIMGGMALHEGNIAEMRTGEGKTLTATMPVFLNALSGQGVHVVTVNEYLATRDAEEMGELYRWMGLTVGLNRNGLSADEKRVAYDADVTFTTNSELGFDYLRDNMAKTLESRVQRTPSYAVLDEIDSILIDEARTPLIISGQAHTATQMYKRTDFFAKSLIKDADFTLDLESKTAALTEEGMDKAEKVFRTDNLYADENQALLHHIDKSIQANYLMLKDKDYVVDDGSIKIVDQFTGRIMDGRRYSDGLHQSIEAKENVAIQNETKTMANITYQNLFRMYKKLSGMTGTAKTEEEEFREIYNMHVVSIPTNRPIARDDRPDLLYLSLDGKYKAVVHDIIDRHKRGQPVLVGTASVEVSEHIGELLTLTGVPHEVLNAKNHFREAEIIMNAGQMGAVTIATNMAGRGTDIKLGPGVRELGGLAVIGTERHESRRIDNQLRGRSGRQGDVGVSQFYLSLEDELMERFGTDKMKSMMQMLSGEADDTPIQSRLITKQVEGAQERVEGNNYDTRKNVLKYDDVLREQREIMYRDRLDVLERDDVSSLLDDMRLRSIKRAVDTYETEQNIEGLLAVVTDTLNLDVNISDIRGMNRDALTEHLNDLSRAHYAECMSLFSWDDQRRAYERDILLRQIDNVWTDHIDHMDMLRQGVGLQSYAQGDPFIEYQERGFRMFEEMIGTIDDKVTAVLMHTNVAPSMLRAS